MKINTVICCTVEVFQVDLTLRFPHPRNIEDNNIDSSKSAFIFPVQHTLVYISKKIDGFSSSGLLTAT